jgi:hypothetical protein
MSRGCEMLVGDAIPFLVGETLVHPAMEQCDPRVSLRDCKGTPMDVLRLCALGMGELCGPIYFVTPPQPHGDLARPGDDESGPMGVKEDGPVCHSRTRVARLVRVIASIAAVSIRAGALISTRGAGIRPASSARVHFVVPMCGRKLNPNIKVEFVSILQFHDFAPG